MVEFSKEHLALWCLLNLAFLILWYQPQKNTLQAGDCHLPSLFASILPDSLISNAESLGSFNKVLSYFHEVSASFIWMQLAVGIGFVGDWNIGKEMYAVVVLGHVVKNFSKSFIQSPRGFWFCEEGHAIYCGTGKFEENKVKREEEKKNKKRRRGMIRR